MHHIYQVSRHNTRYNSLGASRPVRGMQRSTEKEKELSAAEDTFKSEVEKLQATYEKLSKEKDAAIKEVKESRLSPMKAVRPVRRLL